MGMSWFAAAAGELVGAPIAGALLNAETGEYTLAQAVLGAIGIVDAACLVWPLIAMGRSDSNERVRTPDRAQHGEEQTSH